MDFEWDDFLKVARKLAENDDSASLRSAVSRAYYAAFGVASQVLIKAGHSVPSDGSAHDFVWSMYRSADNGPLYFIGQDGVRLRRKRRLADYDANASFKHFDAQKAIREAQTTIAAVQKHGAPIHPGSTDE